MLHKLDNPISQCSLKFVSDTKGEFEGYASVFDSNDQVNDTIIKGAFSRFENEKIPMFINHDHKQIPVGSYVGQEDDYGFKVRGSINLDHKDGPSIYSALKREDVKGQSIGFSMSADDFERKVDGGRIIKNLELREISVVTFPCEPKAMITSVKSMEEIETVRDLERFIRDEFAVSKSLACTFLSHAKRILSGDLMDAEKQIRELNKRISQKQAVDSLLNTIEKLGVS